MEEGGTVGGDAVDRSSGVVEQPSTGSADPGPRTSTFSSLSRDEPVLSARVPARCLGQVKTYLLHPLITDRSNRCLGRPDSRLSIESAIPPRKGSGGDQSKRSGSFLETNQVNVSDCDDLI